MCPQGQARGAHRTSRVLSALSESKALPICKAGDLQTCPNQCPVAEDCLADKCWWSIQEIVDRLALAVVLQRETSVEVCVPGIEFIKAAATMPRMTIVNLGAVTIMHEAHPCNPQGTGITACPW